MEKKSEERKPKSQLPKMHSFQLTQKNFAMAGIHRSLVTQAYPINLKISLGFVILNAGAIFTLIFTFFDAKTFAEYTQTIYLFSLVALIIFALLIVVFKVDKLFEFIDTCIGIVNTSEYQNPDYNFQFKNYFISFFSIEIFSNEINLL